MGCLYEGHNFWEFSKIRAPSFGVLKLRMRDPFMNCFQKVGFLLWGPFMRILLQGFGVLFRDPHMGDPVILSPY